ncbi:MAG TPA: mandelate racemase/muconate lactonizing enzyme family protein [Pirellulaceae bacterium]|nr:mandelate racemase/muconate lactonizing enzyme family protein [Pirellulaceae bacterium]
MKRQVENLSYDVMRITKLETFLANCGLRNYLFLRLTTDTGLTGVGEATLEWQELTVQTLIHEWLEERILGVNPLDIEQTFGNLIRDQYQGGSTVMTAISGAEIACWDLVGKACGQPVYKLLGGRARERLPAYANGWYGGAQTPQQYAEKANEVVSRGYGGMKFDPLSVAWKEMSREEMDDAEQIVAAVRQAVGSEIDLMIEVHGRLSVSCAIEMGRRLAKYDPAWYEEPVTPHSLDQLLEVKQALPFPIAAGERLYMLEEFERLAALRACDVVQMDLAHCGGLHVGKKIAALAQPQDMLLSPHCSIGPVALCAALHFDWSTPHVLVQENFAEYDVPWRNDLVCGWNPIHRGEFVLPDKPGLGIELNEDAIAKHPYQKHSFPSLWDQRWVQEFTKKNEPSH